MTYAIPVVLYPTELSSQLGAGHLVNCKIFIDGKERIEIHERSYLNLSFMSLPLSARLASFAASCKLYTVVPLHMDTSLMWAVSYVPTIFSYITSKKNLHTIIWTLSKMESGH